MKIIGTTFEKLPRERLVIGFEGENLRATVRIDCASVFAEYPNATPALIVKPLFADAYPVVVDRNGTDVDWLITSEILSFSGDGEIQLVFYKDEVICKSAVSKIRVCRSLQVTGDMPDPVAQWIDDANRKLAEVDAQIVELEGMVDTATDAATRAEQSASTASTKAEQAAGSAATATEKATEATNAAGTATAKAAEAALSATQASNSATSAANSESVATAKAAEAAQSAQTAAQKAEQITEAAQIATGKAEEASASATAAQESATDAASSATAASASETAAKASETAAGASATQAAQSAQGASADAQTATQKAAEAQQSATGAAQSEQTATQKAGEAEASAQAASDAKTAVEQTAEQLADRLEQIEQNTQDIAEHEQYAEATYAKKTDLYKKADIIHNTASGAIASFPDGAEMPVDEVTAQINPVQDLHGYDHPWPAGGGVNKIDVNQLKSYGTTYGLRTSFDGDWIVLSGEYTSTSQNANFGIAQLIDTSVFPVTKFKAFPDSNTSPHMTSAPFGLADGNKTLTIYISGMVQGETYNLRFKIVGYEGDTAPTEWTPYSNICPITGFNSVKVTRCGKNLFDSDNKHYGYWLYNVWHNGNPGGWYGIIMPIEEGQSLHISGNRSVQGTNFAWLTSVEDPSKGLSGHTAIVNSSANNMTFTTPTGAKALWVPQDSTADTSVLQLELGSTATAYEPYQGETYSISFPSEARTVYGGSLSIAEDGSGVLTVTKESLVFDSSAWSFSSNFFYKANTVEVGKNASGYYTTENGIMMYLNSNNGQARIYLADNDFLTSESDVGSMLNGYKLLYELATPITYTLTASEITTLLGENNLWHDANGDISVGYKANTKLYIDGKIAELVAQIVNS